MPARPNQIHLKLEAWQMERLEQFPAGERSQIIRRALTEFFAREDQRKETTMLRAEFAIRQEPRSEYVEFWVLKEGESWHNAVRGDGGSYRPGGPETLRQAPGETSAAFQARAEQAARDYTQP